VPGDDVVHPEEVDHPAPPRRDQVAARVADACSTVGFLTGNVMVIVGWAIGGSVSGIDRFPFSGLTLLLSIEAIALTIFVLVQQRLSAEMRDRESEADLKNDAIAAEAAQATCAQLDRIEQLLTDR
jgi:uncharacterized membrane protein